MASALRPQVLSGYRELLRAIHNTFRADTRAIIQCTGEARKAFRANVSERDQDKIKRMVADAHEAASFLRQHIAQAKLNDAGRYEVHLQASHADPSSPSQIQMTGAKEAAAAGTKSTQAKQQKTSDDGASGCCGGGCH